MKRTRLKNKAIISSSVEDWKNYKIQRNICSKMNFKTQREFYSNLDISHIDSNTKFLRTFKPLLSDRYDPGGGKIVLVENQEIISDDTIIANTFNNYFTNITSVLDIKDWNNPESTTSEINLNEKADYIERIKEKFKYHPSIIKINNSRNEQSDKQTFEFSYVTPQQVSDQITMLRTNKSARGDIPIKLIKLASKVSVTHLTDCINSAISNSNFPEELKVGDITPAFKSDDQTNKAN